MQTATPEDIIVAVGRLADDRKWDELQELFSDEVVLDYGTPERLAPADVIDRWRPILSSYDRTHHDITDISLMVDGDRADCICEFEATHWMSGAPGGDTWTLRGEYIHKLQRSGGTWKITEIQMIPIETDGNEDLPRLAESDAEQVSKTLTRRRNRQVLEAFFSSLENRDVQAFRRVWHDNARKEMPFSPDGFPDVLDGKDAITSHYAKWLGELRNLNFNRTIVDTLDPTRFIVIYTGAFNGDTNGGHYHTHYVGFFEIPDGRIATLTEYANPDALRRVARRIPSTLAHNPPIPSAPS